MQDDSPFAHTSDTPGQRAAALLNRAAPTPATVLLLGESGVGKTRLAKWVHAHSPVSRKAFVAINCPALSEQRLEAELFGHARGAFPGARKDQSGKIHAAEGGTLFLDEIGEFPKSLQPRLLRLLQEREYERAGETEARQANIRIIAATNRDLHRQVELGTFREDLFYRLSVLSIEVPPLRHRREEIPAIARHMLAEIKAELNRPELEIQPEALAYLNQCAWRGNLREMRSAIARAAAMGANGSVRLEHLTGFAKPEDDSHRRAHDTAAGGTIAAGDPVTIEQLETEHIRRTLDHSTSLTAAAKLLGIDTSTLFRKRRRLGL